MSEPHCYGSLQLCRLRAALLLPSGAPDDGANNGYVTTAAISAGISLTLKEGDDLELIDGCGNVCQSFKDCDRIKRATVELDLCILDSELISLLIGGGTLFQQSGDAIGFGLPGIDADCPNGVALELWTKAWDGAVQATPPFLGGTTNAYWKFVFPKVKFQLGDMTLENGFAHFPLTGIAEENPNITANGPFNDWPTGVANAGGVVTSMGFFLEDDLPAAACGFIAVPSGS